MILAAAVSCGGTGTESDDPCEPNELRVQINGGLSSPTTRGTVSLHLWYVVPSCIEDFDRLSESECDREAHGLCDDIHGSSFIECERTGGMKIQSDEDPNTWITTAELSVLNDHGRTLVLGPYGTDSEADCEITVAVSGADAKGSEFWETGQATARPGDLLELNPVPL